MKTDPSKSYPPLCETEVQGVLRTEKVGTLKYILEFSYTTVHQHGTNYSHTISKTAASRDTSMCETGKLRLDLMEPEASFFCQAKI